MNWPFVSRERYEAAVAGESFWQRVAEDTSRRAAEHIYLSDVITNRKLDEFTCIEWRILADHLRDFPVDVGRFAKLSEKVRDLENELVVRELIINRIGSGQI